MRLHGMTLLAWLLLAAAAHAAAPAPTPGAIDGAVWAVGQSDEAGHLVLIRAQIILDRAHFSPGVVDGRDGANFRRALWAFTHAGAPPVGDPPALDLAAWTLLVATDAAPVMRDYVVTDADAKGPFIGAPPEDLAVMAKLPRLDFATPAQALSAAFHMDEALLRALNPGAAFGVPGTHLVVARPAATPVPPVALIVVDKSNDEVRGLDAGGRVVAVFPATVGSAERPAPSGQFAVRVVVPNPNYTHDPKRLTFGKPRQGKLTIQPGPNNPVGSTWIDLTIDTYGIHGTPDPRLVGKSASHGCVRLTNWDVAALGLAVKPGTPVRFVGTQGRLH